MNLYYNSNSGHTIELHGDTLMISAWDRTDTELFNWEGLVWECQPFMDLMTDDFLERSTRDIARFIQGHEAELIAWAAKEEGYQQQQKAA